MADKKASQGSAKSPAQDLGPRDESSEPIQASSVMTRNLIILLVTPIVILFAAVKLLELSGVI